MKKQNILLILLSICIAIGAFFMAPKDAEYGGADGRAEEIIKEASPDYEPWIEPIYKPASGEIESALFTLQGSIGAGIIAYIIGYQRGKNQHANH
ncbi:MULTISPECIES: energy-coupling factor ABC transporter substrate-binding protein [unclassified Granulicatella]|uniref:energy-coupling factor ABC transporter substrate-binding protein n=1 Tax=unclassified Granulicatella TaxID=2630493 RepID=UPI0010746795|nr:MULTISPECIES: energy-coupling factor ABC transporter substrate-binding protein [unclassified Granulicatella]MBF0779524.1 energy-coupling factor ABC transporter substrate-binding protein [Granulicatella sp. 19428wC4_WM01]TFU96489.1 energy-coupling factor ABC transporter substrate-binding protein [Granulicatella sp. WM01]